jgi:hypothetical protein
LDDDAGGADAGSAYVFVRSGGAWVQEAKLTGAPAAALDYFGNSVAVDGDTLIVGAYSDSYAGHTDAGSVYVFVRAPAVWTQQAKLTGADGSSWDYFGGSVALDGDTVVIGASLDDHTGVSDAGSAYVFVRSGGVWAQTAKLTAADAARSDWFGYSVALSGDTAVIGAPYEDDAGGPQSGAAYVFVRADGVWTQAAKLTASDAAASDYFGYSVALDGDITVIGAYGDDHSGASDAGAVYVFARPPDGWLDMNETAKLTAASPAAGALFGCSVGVKGNTVIVGAEGDDQPGCTDAGSVYLFTHAGAEWTQTAKLVAADAAAYDSYGHAVVVDDRTAVVGACYGDRVPADNAGAAYVCDLSCAHRGDLNCDGLVDFDDINPFVAALVDQAAYETRYPDCRWLNGDIDGNQAVDFEDINPFVTCLVNSGCP